MSTEAEAIENLTDGQRQCLRLVFAHLNSKEIARELDISPHTVDQRLKAAMRTMQASSRFEAARIFAQYDDPEEYQSLVYQRPEIAQTVQPAKLATSAERERLDGSNEPFSRQGNGPTNGATLTWSEEGRKRNRFPIPRYRGEKNELSSVERLGWVVVIAIGSALSFGGLLAGLEALSRLRG